MIIRLLPSMRMEHYTVMLSLFDFRGLSYRTRTLAANQPYLTVQPMKSDIQSFLMGISLVPLSTYLLLHCLGTAHIPDNYYLVPRIQNLEIDWNDMDEEELKETAILWALGLSTTNFRDVLLLSSEDTPLMVRSTTQSLE
ncbi:hypothetical protein RUM44_011392 [Polyplax serrata]|uniref:Uncharacterized protein n=1 Tax=Polyplax serrata TaxID=468196 RepID=A0ABR1APW7_POLSC